MRQPVALVVSDKSEVSDDISSYHTDRESDQMIAAIRNRKRYQATPVAAVESSDFLGSGWSFPPTFDISSGSITMAQGEEDIRQSLTVLFSTMLRERIMLPDFGCKLNTFIFSTINSTLSSQIEDALSWSILYYEPRITDVNIVVTVANLPEGILNISLSYLIQQTNIRSNMVFPFYLNGEGTNVRKILGPVS
ncbi:GPW/gp25 family protein [Undibacterium sp. SXout7W]|uniref:GPW/gp25 family protein n=1 Tax=Undibacterium sp. SXout7W TaxID=3413049 RepID=UPI003BF07597